MTRLLLALALLLSTAILPAEDSPAVGLEARLKESAEASPQAAALMLELIALYTEEEQVFGLIRTAAKFSRAQPSHPKRPEVMISLIKGYAIASRHDDVIATGRQFVEKYPEHPLAVTAQDHLATSFERTGKLIPAADAQAASWTQSGQPALPPTNVGNAPFQPRHPVFT